MKSILVALCVLMFFLPICNASECDPLVASYNAIYTEDSRPSYARLEIREETAESVSVRYMTDRLTGQFSNYIVDGKSHPGDGIYSGDSYVASCSKGELTVTMINQQLKYPLIYNFALVGGVGLSELQFKESVGATIKFSQFRRAP